MWHAQRLALIMALVCLFRDTSAAYSLTARTGRPLNNLCGANTMMSDTSAETTVFSDHDHSSAQLHSCVEKLRNDGVKVSIDDPALFVDWNVRALVEFEREAGNHGATPGWVLGGAVTTSILQSSIITRVGAVAGGVHGMFCFAPNTQAQFGSVLKILSHTESDPWMQGPARREGDSRMWEERETKAVGLKNE
eukprot:3163999-Rhodomonas_salina.1